MNFLALSAQLAAMVTAITSCLLCGMYIQTDKKLAEEGNLCGFKGYGKRGLTYATIIVDGIAALVLMVGMLVTLIKKDEALGLQMAFTGLPAVLISVGCILIGALVGVVVSED